MDLVLEVADHYVFDDLYAKVLPTTLAANIPAKWQNLLGLNGGFSNSTILQETLNSKNAVKECRKFYGQVPFLFDMTTTSFASLLPRSSILREFLSLWVIVTIFGLLLYLFTASLSYVFVFDKSIFNHPRYLKNQMAMEIKLAVSAIPWMSMLTAPWFVMELNGHSKLYMKIDYENHGVRKLIIEYFTFIFFTDCGVYLAHRWLHWPRVYRALHKPHHKWLVCTPFASHSFHPIDGFLQSISYHIYPLILPLHKVSYLILFTFVNFWTVMIHDGQYLSNNPAVNGTACHTVHHLYFNYNYGQFTTLWDRLGGSYRRPDDSLFDPKLRDSKETWDAQVKEVEHFIKEVEGDDNDRVYENDPNTKKNN